MIRKFIIICSLIVATASCATEDCSARLLDDLELSRWNVAAPEIWGLTDVTPWLAATKRTFCVTRR